MSRTSFRFVYLAYLALSLALVAQPVEQADRVERIRQIMRNNPEQAVQLLLPEDLSDLAGDLIVEVHDDFEEGRTTQRLFLNVEGELLRLRTTTGMEGLACSGQAIVRGFRSGEDVLVAGIRSAPAPRESPACSTTGVQSTVVILAALPSLPLPSHVTPAYVQSAFSAGYHSVGGFYVDASYSKTLFATTVAGPFTLDSDYDCTSTSALVGAAIRAADGAVNFQNFNRIVVLAPRKSTCSIGVGSIGCTSQSSPGDGSFRASYAFVAADAIPTNDALVSIAAHELGHNLGLGHSNSRDFGNVALGPVGGSASDKEYWDVYSMMGLSFNSSGSYVLGHFAPQHKVQMAWLTSGADYQNVESSGSYTLNPYSANTPGLKAIRVRRGTGINEWLWIENRQPFGSYDNSLSAYSNLAYKGVLVRHERPQDPAGNTYLLHYSPVAAPNEFRNAPLLPGARWDDPSTNLSLEVVQSGSSMLVTVTYRAGACSYTLSPTQASVSHSGGGFSFNVSTGANCAWQASTSSPFVTFPSGATGAGSGTVQFAVDANTTSLSRIGIISVGGQIFTVNQAGVPSPAFTVSGRITSGSAALAGVTVALSGSASTSTVTNSTGDYSFSGVAGGGNYTVTPSKPGYLFTPATSTVTALASNYRADFVAGTVGMISLSRSKLQFAANVGGSAVTPAQQVTLVVQNGPANWTASSDKSWLKVSPASGLSSGNLSISLVAGALPGPGPASATITISAPGAQGSPLTLPVSLNVYSSSGAPWGIFDTPVDNAAGLAGNIAVTGWALDDIGIEKVTIWRSPVGPEPVHGNGYVYIADGVFVPNSRPDVEAAYPNAPMNYRAGWGYLMLTNFLPNLTGPGGNGTYYLHAFAHDKEGKITKIGSKTIHVSNATSVKPFGTIDTPNQGETIGGSSYVNFGWALTPQPQMIPVNGSTLQVSIDGVFLGSPVYGNHRVDIATAFPGYANSNGAVGYFYLDTTKYSDGMHNIGWLVTDNGGRQDGVGSRFFFIQNGVVANVVADPLPRIGGLDRARRARAAQLRSVRIAVAELARIEHELPQGAGWTGYQRVGDELRPLPVGSTLDVNSGKFYWQLGPGFLGTYELVFIDEAGREVGLEVTVR